jgi:flavin-dependent dehydrogenase
VPTDVLVVGAGPAGSIAALTLARAGVKVRLVDRAGFPRDKLCGDTVNPGTLSLLDALDLGPAVRAASRTVSGMTVTGPLGVSVIADYPAGLTGAALSRRELDRLLIEAAVNAGVTFDDRVSVAAADLTDGRVNGVRARCGGSEYAVPATVVIAADGRASRLAGSLGLSAFAAQPRRWAFGAYFDGVAALTDRGEMHIRPDGYVGIAPLPGGVANVCCVRELTKGRGDLLAPAGSGRAGPGRLAARGDQTLLEAILADRTLRDRFADARQISDVRVLGPLAVDARAAGCPGLLLAGDAAGFVDPMTGDGLRFAVRGGMLAAEYALRELETGAPQHRALCAARRREFAGKWRVNRVLRSLVASPRGVALAARVAIRWPAPIRALVAIAGDVGLAGKASAGDARRCAA